MEKNVGKNDRVIRIALGVVLVALALYWKCFFCMIVGLILLVTAGIGFCPLYKVLKKNTCEKKQ